MPDGSRDEVFHAETSYAAKGSLLVTECGACDVVSWVCELRADELEVKKEA